MIFVRYINQSDTAIWVFFVLQLLSGWPSLPPTPNISQLKNSVSLVKSRWPNRCSCCPNFLAAVRIQFVYPHSKQTRRNVQPCGLNIRNLLIPAYMLNSLVRKIFSAGYCILTAETPIVAGSDLDEFDPLFQWSFSTIFQLKVFRWESARRPPADLNFTRSIYGQLTVRC